MRILQFHHLLSVALHSVIDAYDRILLKVLDLLHPDLHSLLQLFDLRHVNVELLRLLQHLGLYDGQVTLNVVDNVRSFFRIDAHVLVERVDLTEALGD